MIAWKVSEGYLEQLWSEHNLHGVQVEKLFFACRIHHLDIVVNIVHLNFVHKGCPVEETLVLLRFISKEGICMGDEVSTICSLMFAIGIA
jgi:hypothetical protein